MLPERSQKHCPVLCHAFVTEINTKLEKKSHIRSRSMKKVESKAYKELLAEIRQKRKVHGMWKEGQATWEAYRNVVRACRDATRKAKAHLELKLAKG